MYVDVKGDEVKFLEKDEVNGGSINYYEFEFTFDEVWNGLTKVAVILDPKKRHTEIIPIVENSIYAPFIKEGKPYAFGVVGFEIDGEKKTKQISTNLLFFNVRDGAGSVMEKGGDVPPADVWEQYLQAVTRLADEAVEAKDEAVVARDEAVEARDEAVEAKSTTETLRNETENFKNEALDARDDAEEFRDEAEGFSDDAEDSESKTTQAYQDFLNQLGTEVATLTDGKLTPSQIPALSINDIFEVSEVDELLELIAQRGDVGLIMGVDENDQPVVVDSYILASDDPTILANWKKLGVSYVANAGRAVTAGTAENSDRINGHRLITMTEMQYENAVLDEGTLYAVYPD